MLTFWHVFGGLGLILLGFILGAHSGYSRGYDDGYEEAHYEWEDWDV